MAARRSSTLGYTISMCGRYALAAPRSQLCHRFGLDQCAEYSARYNIAPGTDIAVIRQSSAGRRVLDLLRWGLRPHWAQKSAATAVRPINARGESLSEKPTFRDSFRHRRCLIPASGFYEWQVATGSGKARTRQPWYVSLQSVETMAFGGLWQSWTAPSGEIIGTCCIVTTAANPRVNAIHERMPLILAPAHWQDWLTAEADLARELIRPYPAAEIQLWPVSRRVGRVAEDDPELMQALSGEWS